MTDSKIANSAFSFFVGVAVFLAMSVLGILDSNEWSVKAMRNMIAAFFRVYVIIVMMYFILPITQILVMNVLFYFDKNVRISNRIIMIGSIFYIVLLLAIFRRDWVSIETYVLLISLVVSNYVMTHLILKYVRPLYLMD